jgi:tRNA nucleotidyltransferase (CCA-adding enzyme)
VVGRLPCEMQVLEKIRPRRREHNHIWEVACELVETVDESGEARGMVVGSVARDTWITGDRDLDVFMLFDPALPRADLEHRGLDLARQIAGRFGDGMREKYSEHPYINTTIRGLDVDLVPCYAVASAAGIQSAVDRTPFHTRYIREAIDGFVDDVLLMKQFTKAAGIYGSDHMTEGFAGYLCELLVIRYGGFTPLIEAAGAWEPGLVIDIAGHQAKEFDDPLVVIDPVDPKRNVAASLSMTRMFEFVELARGYAAEPAIDYFLPRRDAPLTRDGFCTILATRATHLYAIVFSTPQILPDVLVPQLRKSLEAIGGMLDRYGFSVSRMEACMEQEHSMLLFELLVEELPPLKRHMGPNVWHADNAENFLAKWAGSAFSGPYIDDGRYYVEISRKHTHAFELLRSPSPLKVSLGKHVKIAMDEGWTLHVGDEVWQEEFVPFLSSFLQKQSPLLRIRRQREDPGID